MSRLAGVEKVAVEAELLLGQKSGGGSALLEKKRVPGGLNRRVVIDEDRHCAVCHKRFGGSAIRVYPDNSVVHSGCLRGSIGRKKTDIAGWR